MDESVRRFNVCRVLVLNTPPYHARHHHRGEDEAVHYGGDGHVRQLAPRESQERKQRDQNRHQRVHPRVERILRRLRPVRVVLPRH